MPAADVERGAQSLGLERDDYVFEGYELSDALEVANAALEDDVRVMEEDGRTAKVQPFKRDEVLRPLERWFFGRSR